MGYDEKEFAKAEIKVKLTFHGKNATLLRFPGETIKRDIKPGQEVEMPEEMAKHLLKNYSMIWTIAGKTAPVQPVAVKEPEEKAPEAPAPVLPNDDQEADEEEDEEKAPEAPAV